MTPPFAASCRRPSHAALLLFSIGVAGAASAAPVQWLVSEGGNGHYYERVFTGATPTWESARAAAAAMTYQGVPGHLATITSEGERQFILANEVFGPGDSGQPAWIGGVQQPGAASAADGWTWVTGEPWGFTAWAPGEPNEWPDPRPPDRGNEQHVSVFNRTFGTNSGLWNDENGVQLRPLRGFLVEFDTVPEPSAALLLPAALSLLSLRRRSRP